MTTSLTTTSPATDLISSSGDITPTSSGTLNLRPEVLEGFLLVRDRHEALQALLHQMMRKVALPRAWEIGQELIRLKGFYSSGKKGPGGHASRFYSDAKAITGLSKASVANYTLLAESRHKLLDYMVELPEGATPITSMKGALEALREMNRPLRPASDAIDVEAQQVAGGDAAALGAGGSRKRTTYAASTREKVIPALTTLRATTMLTDRQREQLAKIEEMLHLLLDQIDRQEEEQAAAAETEAAQQVVDASPVEEAMVISTDTTPASDPAPAPQWSEPEPAAAAEEQQVEVEEPSGPARGTLTALYPLTAEGLAALEAAITDAGSGAALGRQLGGYSKQGISGHLKRIRAAVEG